MHVVVTPGGLRYRPSLAARLLGMLRFMGRHGADAAMLIEIAYGDNPDGGPMNPNDAISRRLYQLRRAGHAITRQPQGRRGRYVLAPLAGTLAETSGGARAAERFEP